MTLADWQVREENVSTLTNGKWRMGSTENKDVGEKKRKKEKEGRQLAHSGRMR